MSDTQADPLSPYVNDDLMDEIELTRIDDLLSGEGHNDRYSGEKITSDFVPRYEMIKTVGQGAMGKILLAIDQNLRRKVAYKMVHAEMASNRKVMGRFLTEAQITAQLDHPNIVPIYSLEVMPDGDIGYSMKMIHGKTLKELIIEARQQYDDLGKPDDDHSFEGLLDHFLKVCDAMHYAHIKGVIHRDLKPANIMIGPYNEVYVMDWGIAKIIKQPEQRVDDELVELIRSDPGEPEMERTQMGQIVGTPRYLSPQQAAGKNDELDGRSDLFTLGLILFELVTLRPAFKGTSQIDLFKKILKVELEPFVHYKHKQRIPAEIQAIIGKATGKKTDQRYISVEAMADDIRRYLRGEAVLAKPDTPMQSLLRWMSHHRELTLGLVLTLILLSASATIYSMYQQQIAIQKAHEHQQNLSAFLMHVAKKAQEVDSQFLKGEALLAQMAGSAIQLLEYGEKQNQRVYTDIEIGNPDDPPPDLRFSPFYDQNLTLDYNTYKLAPGLTREEAEPLMQVINPLRFVFREILLRSHQDEAIDLSPIEQQKLILDQGVPLIWVYVGLKQGLHVAYPGKTGYKPEYDPRLRPWYKDSLKQPGSRWLSPYIDTGGKGWVLPCTMPLWAPDGQFLGVAGVEMTLSHIKQQYLQIQDLPGVLNAYLINAEGEVIASSQEKDQAFQMGILVNKSRDLKPYPRPEVIAALKSKHSGYYEYREAQENRVLAYYPISSLGWYYLVEARTSDLDH